MADDAEMELVEEGTATELARVRSDSEAVRRWANLQITIINLLYAGRRCHGVGAPSAAQPAQVGSDAGQSPPISIAGRNCDEELSDVDVPSSYSVSDRMWHCLLCKSSDKHRMPSWHARDIP